MTQWGFLSSPWSGRRGFILTLCPFLKPHLPGLRKSHPCATYIAFWFEKVQDDHGNSSVFSNPWSEVSMPPMFSCLRRSVVYVGRLSLLIRDNWGVDHSKMRKHELEAATLLYIVSAGIFCSCFLDQGGLAGQYLSFFDQESCTHNEGHLPLSSLQAFSFSKQLDRDAFACLTAADIPFPLTFFLLFMKVSVIMSLVPYLWS